VLSFAERCASRAGLGNEKYFKMKPNIEHLNFCENASTRPVECESAC